MNGFVGSHLVDFLLTRPDIEIFGGGFGGKENIAHLEGRAVFVEGDLRQPEVAESLLKQTQPDRIYHLAGQAFAPISWQDPWGTIEINLRSEVNLLNAAVRANSLARILVIGTIEEYGRVEPENLPITEETPLRPDTPYGVSKIAQDYL